MNQFKHLLFAASIFLQYSCSEEQATVIVDIYYKESLTESAVPNMQEDLAYLANVFQSEDGYIVPSITVHRVDLPNHSHFFSVRMPNSNETPTTKDEFSRAFSAMILNYHRPPLLVSETNASAIVVLQKPYYSISLDGTLPNQPESDVFYYSIEHWMLDVQQVIESNKNGNVRILINSGFSRDSESASKGVQDHEKTNQMESSKIEAHTQERAQIPTASVQNLDEEDELSRDVSKKPSHEENKQITTDVSDLNREEDEEDSDYAYMIVEKMPAFGKCKELRSFQERHECTRQEIVQYIATNTRYPPIARDAGIQGTVFVYFVVDKTGAVKDAKVMREVDPRLDAEALRVIRSLPKFEPGELRAGGKPVSVEYTIPVKFVIR